MDYNRELVNCTIIIGFEEEYRVVVTFSVGVLQSKCSMIPTGYGTA
jgi:hypothetical protein